MSPPQQIDRYLVEHELGRGAFGVVFRARHAVTGRAVALKVLHSRHVGDTELVERFFREARAAASTRSPHIVDVLDASVAADGAPFLALELLEGSDLEGRLTREGRLPLAEALRLAREIATGLEAAHRSGVIHRDLKPANVFLARQGDGSTRVKILDFGMSKLAEPSAVRTGTGAVMGTPLYMAPEQLAGGAREADARADLYALGAILFEMLAGTAPHDAPSLDALVTLKLTQPARDLATLAPGVPGPVVALVHRCLSLRPDARPASATEVQEALATLDRSSAPTPSTATPSSATPSAPTPGAAQTAQSSVGPAPQPVPRWALALLGAAVLGTMCFAGIALLGAGGTVWAVLASPESAHPVTASPDTVHPVTANPDTVHPITAHPVTAHPVTASPVTTSPVTASPVTASPVTASPVTAHPVTAHPEETRRADSQSGEARGPAEPVEADVAEATVRETSDESAGVTVSVSRLGGGDVSLERAIAEAARPTLARCRGETRVVEEVQLIWIGPRLLASDGTALPPTAARQCIEDALVSTRHAGASTGIVRFHVLLDAR